MARGLSLDLSALVHLIQRSPEAAARGAHSGMDDIKDNWVVEARNIAPLDTGNLRRQISGEVEGRGFDSEVIVTGNATSRSAGGRNFNYGYYIHEGHMRQDGKHLRHPGTEEEFLDKSGERNKQRYLDMLEDEIRRQLEREGW